MNKEILFLILTFFLCLYFPPFVFLFLRFISLISPHLNLYFSLSLADLPVLILIFIFLIFLYLYFCSFPHLYFSCFFSSLSLLVLVFLTFISLIFLCLYLYFSCLFPKSPSISVYIFHFYFSEGHLFKKFHS